MGPGYTQPYGRPPTQPYTGQAERHAPHRMHLSASRYLPSRTALRPQSISSTCSRRGPSASPSLRGPVRIDTQEGSGCPEALRDSRRRKTGRSAMRGTTFSIPATTRCTRGSRAPARAFPSFDSRTTDPVSATRKFAPVTPKSARRKLPSSRFRAIAARPAASEAGGSPSFRSNRRETACRVMWKADDRMCEGGSPARRATYPPRSVSTSSTPASRRASSREISSAAVDFDRTASATPSSLATRATISRARAASRATWTTVPLFSASSMNRARCSSRRDSVSRRSPEARSRAASKPAKDATAAARRASMRPTAFARAACSSLSERALSAFRSNARESGSITVRPPLPPPGVRPPGPGPGGALSPGSRTGRSSPRCSAGIPCPPW